MKKNYSVIIEGLQGIAGFTVMTFFIGLGIAGYGILTKNNVIHDFGESVFTFSVIFVLFLILMMLSIWILSHKTKKHH